MPSCTHFYHPNLHVPPITQGWSFNITEYQGEDASPGSFALARACVDVQGEGAYDLMKFEAGVHRVQRSVDCEAETETEIALRVWQTERTDRRYATSTVAQSRQKL